MSHWQKHSTYKWAKANPHVACLLPVLSIRNAEITCCERAQAKGKNSKDFQS